MNEKLMDFFAVLGFSCILALQIVFIVLKLTHVVAWNWFIIFLPSIITIAITEFLIIIILVGITKILHDDIEYEEKLFANINRNL